MQRDANTGIILDGMYYRIDKINFNDVLFQVVMTGYASQQAFQDQNLPISQPRAYTWEYEKNDLLNISIFEYSYNMIKEHPDFKGASDVFENDADIEEHTDEVFNEYDEIINDDFRQEPTE